MTIETKQLKIISCDTEILSSAIEGNVMLAKKMNVTIPVDWTEFGKDALLYSLQKLAESEEEKNWWTYFPIFKEENKLIGSGGYKGKPSKDGIVEIGYEIAPTYRNRGLATEMTQGLVANAFKYEKVRSVIAHTLGHENPSTKVLQKNGFKRTKEFRDQYDNLIWKWELDRP